MAAAAAIIADAVFDVVGVVGVRRTIFVLDIGIVLGARVFILDHERDRRARGHLFPGRLVGEYAGQDFDNVGFLALGGVARLAGTAFVQIWLNVGFD